jgi:putative ABC transport system permease protein
MATDAIKRLVWLAYPAVLRQECGEELAAGLTRCISAEISRLGSLGVLTSSVRALFDAIKAHVHLRRSVGRTSASPHEPGHGRDSWFSRLWQDVRYTGRSWMRTPGFYAGLVLTLGLGIGANTAVFTLVQAVLLQPLPYANQDRLVMIWRSRVQEATPSRGISTPAEPLSYRDHASDLLDIAAIKDAGSSEASMDFMTPSGVVQLNGARVTPEFFEVIGAQPLLGRLFTSSDPATGNADGLVISASFWTEWFGRNPAVLGQSVRLTAGYGKRRAERTYRVIGVLPPGFHFNYDTRIQVWAMDSWEDVRRQDPRGLAYRVVGRLKPGVSVAIATERLKQAFALVNPEDAGFAANLRGTPRIERISEWVAGRTRPTLALLTGVAVLLLIITCVTTANALLIRVTERRRELSLRTALGASRARLFSQLITEGLLLSVAGTVAGVLTAMATLPVLRSIVPVTMPRADEITVSVPILGFAAVVVLLVTLIATAAPAWRGARLQVASALKESAASVSADPGTARWRRVLVGTQAALAAILLAAAGLLLVSAWRLGHTPMGFEADDVWTAEMTLQGQQYGTPDRRRVFQDAVQLGVSRIPGVASVGWTTAVPFRGTDFLRATFKTPAGEEFPAHHRYVDPAYFSIMHITAKLGRLLTVDDNHPSAEVFAVVSESFARTAFGNADPLGQVIKGDPPMTVVGVVGDIRYKSPELKPVPAVYISRTKGPSLLMCLVIEPTPGATDLGPAIRQAIADVDPSIPARRITTIGQIRRDASATRRFYTAATLVFAGLALVLTVAGILIIVARSIAERRREIAIRAALGASSSRLRRLLVAQGLLPVVAGVFVGLGAALAGAPLVAPFLYEVAPRAASVYVAAGLTISLAGIGAALWPARQITAAVPASVLRAE